ncbi:MAG: GNAT family N-acetyltransferase [Flavobacteriaceae bacterium]|nr:GNAT family N-acetyltransferase [Flavobacteriaceae bacterium]
MKLSFRVCNIEDLDELVQISRVTFVDAFEKENNPEDFKNYLAKAFSIEKIKSELLDTNIQFFFTYLNDSLVGYFKLNEGEAQTESFEQNTLELERIYVLQHFQGKQIGKAMLYKAIAIASSKKASFLWLGVWEKNNEAIKFYERYGFKKFMTHTYLIGKDKQTDRLMKLMLH